MIEKIGSIHMQAVLENIRDFYFWCGHLENTKLSSKKVF